jgi:hypothetical protein
MSVCLCSLFSLYSKFMRRILLSFVAWLAMRYFSILSPESYDFRKILLNVKCVRLLLYNCCLKHSLFYRVIKKSLCTWWLQLSQHMSFLPHYLAQSDCLAADRQGQGDTRLTLTPSVVPNSNYVITVSDWNCLKYFFVFFNTIIIRCAEIFWHPVIRIQRNMVIGVHRSSCKLLIIIVVRFEEILNFLDSF